MPNDSSDDEIAAGLFGAVVRHLPMLEFAKGPLGSHLNYLRHIVMPNCMDYLQLQQANRDSGENSNPSKYEELRRFLNAIESMNNIPDYFYWENELALKEKQIGSVKAYRIKVGEKYHVLAHVAELANAYKHCVRTNRDGKKNTGKKWAKDIQLPQMTIDVDIDFHKMEKKEDIKVNPIYKFDWPIASHEKIFNEAFEFWKKYGDADVPDLWP